MTQRFAIISARAVLDPELTDLDIRVLAVLGIHADTDTGWCYRNQAKIAEQLGVARPSVCRSLNRLYDRKYVERHDINAGKPTKGLRSINCYKILLDGPEGPPTLTQDTLSPQGYNASSLSPQSDNRCNPSVTTVVTPGKQLNVPLRTEPVERKIPPNPPSRGGARASSIPKEARKPEYGPAFLRAWASYPGSENGTAGPQAKAWQAWKAEGCEEISSDVAQCIRRYAEAAKKPNAPNTRHMHRWLKERRWEGAEAKETRADATRRPVKPIPVTPDVSPEERAVVREKMRAFAKGRASSERVTY